MSRCTVLLLLLALLPSCASTPDAAAPTALEMSYETPGAEHAALAPMVGSFNAKVVINMGPQDPENTSYGTYDVRSMGGMWLVGSFKSSFEGNPFEGTSLLGYDQRSKQYVSTWCDTMVSAPQVSRGQWDAAKKQLVMRGEGAMQAQREITTLMPDGSIDFVAMMRGPDGKESQTMHIVYTRR